MRFGCIAVTGKNGNQPGGRRRVADLVWTAWQASLIHGSEPSSILILTSRSRGSDSLGEACLDTCQCQTVIVPATLHQGYQNKQWAARLRPCLIQVFSRCSRIWRLVPRRWPHGGSFGARRSRHKRAHQPCYPARQASEGSCAEPKRDGQIRRRLRLWFSAGCPQLCAACVREIDE